jgi:putative ABC transport system permease protein
MIRNYIKIAFRNLFMNKVYSLINITGLALGMAVVILISLLVYDEYSFDRFHTNLDSIYRLAEIQKQEDGLHKVVVTPGPLADVLKKDFSEIEQTLRIGNQAGLLQNGKQRLETEILVIDPSFFTIFDFKLISGSTNKLFENPDEIVLTEKSAAILFGVNWQQKNIIGSMVTLQSFQTFSLKVVGIAQNLPTNSHIQSDVFLPFKLLEKYDDWSMKWGSNNFHTYLKLNPKVNKVAFEQKIASALKKYNNDADTKLYLQPLADIYLKSKFDFQTDWGKRSDIFYVYLFLTVGLIVLIIAIFNFVNLATARATQRLKEVGVRKMAGAGRTNLIFQFLFEALVVVLLATVLTFGLVSQALPLLNQLAEKSLSIPILSSDFWLLIGAFMLFMALFSGIFPAFALSSMNPAKVLKGELIKQSTSGFKKILVVGQFAISIILIICTITIYKQLQFIQNKNLGFDKDHLMYFRLKGDLKNKALVVKNEISKLSSIESISATTNNLVNVSNQSNIEWEGQTQNANFLITQINTDPDFLATIGAKIVSGRNFSNAIARDTSDKIGTYLLNETAARKMGWNNTTALGKKVKFWGFEGEVVGVVKDFHFRPLSVEIEPFIFRNRPKEFYFNLLIKANSSNIKQAIAEISTILVKYEPNQPITYGFVNQDLDKQYFNDQRIGKIIFIFSMLTIIISCLGLFGLVTYTTQQRIKEIGIRKVLGASVVNITTLLSKDFLKLVIIAIVVAAPIAYYVVGEWLQDFAYHIDISWQTFALAGVIALIITLLTVSYQAIRAALMNPVKSLKTD